MVDLSALPPCDFGGRLGRLRSAFDAAEIDALLCTDLVSVRYLTGFTGSNALLLVTPSDLTLITDGRYETQVGEQLRAAGVEAEAVITRKSTEALADVVVEVDRLGLEADHVSWSAAESYDEKLEPIELVATRSLVADLRAVKDEGEVARLEAAAGVADEALANLRERIIAGTVEREFGLALDNEMIRLGADARSFETIVASGPNAAKPHARPTDRVMSEGDLVIVDFGALVDGYHSDMTRTFAVGTLSDTQQRMVDIVVEAQAAGVAAVVPGADTIAVDSACRSVIAEAGWGEAFLHGTGHGIGLLIHEDPRISRETEGTLTAGHCVTVEPGVYLPEHGGVRVEDSVVVTTAGCRALTKYPKEL